MKLHDLKLSFLDVGIIRSNQSSSIAFSSVIALAQQAEKLGNTSISQGSSIMWPTLSQAERLSLLPTLVRKQATSESVAMCFYPIIPLF